MRKNQCSIHTPVAYNGAAKHLALPCLSLSRTAKIGSQWHDLPCRGSCEIDSRGRAEEGPSLQMIKRHTHKLSEQAMALAMHALLMLATIICAVLITFIWVFQPNFTPHPPSARPPSSINHATSPCRGRATQQQRNATDLARCKIQEPALFRAYLSRF